MPASTVQRVLSSESHAPPSTFGPRPPPASTPQASTTGPLRIVSTIDMSAADGKNPLELRAISPENHGSDSDGEGNSGARRSVVTATKKGFLLTEGPNRCRRYVVACEAEREGEYDEKIGATTSEDKAPSADGITSTISADNDCESSSNRHTKATSKQKYLQSESELIAVQGENEFAIRRVGGDKASSRTSSTNCSDVGNGIESSSESVPGESTGMGHLPVKDETSAPVTSEENGQNSSKEEPSQQPRKCSFDAPSRESNGDEGSDSDGFSPSSIEFPTAVPPCDAASNKDTKREEDDEESQMGTRVGRRASSSSPYSSSVKPENIEGAGAERPVAAVSSRRRSLTGGNEEEDPSAVTTKISDVTSATEATNAAVPKKMDVVDDTKVKDTPAVIPDDTICQTGGSGKVSESDDAAEGRVAAEDEDSKTEPLGNCGECIYCLDKTSFGGQRRLRKACIRIQMASRGKKGKIKGKVFVGRAKAGANAGAGSGIASTAATETRSRSLRKRSARTFLRDEQADGKRGYPPRCGRRENDTDPRDEGDAAPKDSKSTVAPEPTVTTRQRKVVAPTPAPEPLPTSEEAASAPPSTNQSESQPPKKKRRKRDSKGRRINRCNNCAACARENCGKCVYCKDMKEFGGPQIKRKACIHRQCRNIKLDNNPDSAAQPPQKRLKKNSAPDASGRVARDESREGDGVEAAGGGERDDGNCKGSTSPKGVARLCAPLCVTEDKDLPEAKLSAANHKLPSQGENGKLKTSKKKSNSEPHSEQNPALPNSKDASQTNKSGRCGVCTGCNSVNCGECIYCKDMTQFGGPHRLRKACLRRRCEALRKKRREKAAKAKKELKKEPDIVVTRPTPNVGDEVKSVESVLECTVGTGHESLVVRKKKPPRPPRKKGERIVTPFQMLSEEISCVARVSFLHTVDSDSESDDDSVWLDEYLNVSGVTRCDITRSKCGKRSNSSADDSADDCEPRYKAKLSHQGTVLNLGSDHYSSAAAAAARDLANTLIRGSEDPRPLDVLSSKEAWTGLRSAGAKGVLPCGKVEPQSLRSTKRKAQFESLIEKSLASIGGHDDFLAQVLVSVDEEAAKEAARKDEVSKLTAAEALENPRKAHRKELLEGLRVERKAGSSYRDKNESEQHIGKITPHSIIPPPLMEAGEVSLLCTETCDDDLIATVNTVRAPIEKSFIVWTEESLQCQEVLPGMEDDESSSSDLLDADVVNKVQTWRRPGWSSRCSKSNSGNCGSCNFCTYLCTLYGEEAKEIDS